VLAAVVIIFAAGFWAQIRERLNFEVLLGLLCWPYWSMSITALRIV